MLVYQLKTPLQFVIVACCFLAFLSCPAFAATPSPTKAPSPTAGPTIADEDVTQSLQERLRKAADDKSSEAEKILGATERRAVVGTLKDVAQTSLTIQEEDKTSQLVSIGGDTVFMRNSKSAKQSDLAIGDYIIAMGYPSNNGGVLDTHRIVALEKQPQIITYQVLAGTVTKVSTANKTFVIETIRPTELGGPETVAISIGKTDLDLTKLEKDKKVIVVALPGKTADSPSTLKSYKVL